MVLRHRRKETSSNAKVGKSSSMNEFPISGWRPNRPAEACFGTRPVVGARRSGINECRTPMDDPAETRTDKFTAVHPHQGTQTTRTPFVKLNDALVQNDAALR